VPDGSDLCPGTSLPESVPTVSLGVNRFADTDGDGVFNSVSSEGEGRIAHSAHDAAHRGS